MNPRIETLALTAANTQYSKALSGVRHLRFKLRDATKAYQYSYSSGVVAAPSANVTFNIATPGTVNWTGHGLSVGDQVYFTATGGIPAALTSGVIYYVSATPSADLFSVSATLGGGSITFAGAGTPTNTCTKTNYISMVAGTTFSEPISLDIGRNTVLYFASSTAAQIVEIEVW